MSVLQVASRRAILGASGSGGGGPVTHEGLIATQCRPLDTSQTAQKQSLSRSAHVATDNITRLKAIFQNFYLLSGERGNATAATVRAYVEYPSGTLTPILFSGAAVGNLAAVASTAHQTTDNGGLLSDYCTVTIPSGSVFWIRELFSNTGGIFYLNGTAATLVGSSLDTANGAVMRFQNASTWGDTELTTPSWAALGTGSTVISRHPLAIIGDTSKATVALCGDSIVYGQNDPFRPDCRQGIMGRAIPATIATVNLGLGGAQGGDYLNEAIARSLVFPYVSNMLNNLGTNGTPTPATNLANNQALCTTAQPVTGFTFPVGCKFFILPVMARTAVDSTTSWSTIAAQTAQASNNQRDYNSLLQDGALPSPFTALFDTNVTGLWQADPTATITDGAMTTGTAILTSASAPFVAGDVNKYVSIPGAGAGGINLNAKINSLNSASSVNLDRNASATVSGKTVKIGLGKIRPRRSSVQSVADAAITSGAAILTSATATFTANDVGSFMRITGAGVASADLTNTTITFTNSTTVTQSGNASTTVSGALAYICGGSGDGLHPVFGSYNDVTASGYINYALFTALP